MYIFFDLSGKRYIQQKRALHAIKEKLIQTYQPEAQPRHMLRCAQGWLTFPARLDTSAAQSHSASPVGVLACGDVAGYSGHGGVQRG